MTGEELRIIRKSRKLSQPQLAAELGVTTTTVWRWENEQSRISSFVEKAIERMAAEIPNRDHAA